MKKSLIAAAMCSALALSFGPVTASAQETVSASEAEGTNLWFVELAGKPNADGSKLKDTRAEKAAFRGAAAARGITFVERRAFDVLFNGFSVKATRLERQKLAALPGVKAIWPVERVAVPDLENGAGNAANLETAIGMTGSDIAHNSLGITGAGIRVAVMDTGLDYDNADLGGDGTTRSNSDQFPNGRVVAGWDFVGDDYDAANPAATTPSPDAYPDDCNGHGSHVAGIVGANGEVVGVAPDVVFGAYRVFGCVGSTDSDIMLAAMERALADGMHVLNMSIGARAQWPQYPTAAAATRLLSKGMVVVASIGNNGPGGSAPDGPYAVGAPGVGEGVIGVASYDNTHTKKLSFIANPGGAVYGYNQAAASPTAPTTGTSPLAKTGTPASAADGCVAADFAAFPAGSIALIRRGTCGFNAKSFNAQTAGAVGVVLYNNAAGELSPTVIGPPAITIPVVAVTAADGAALDALIAAGGATLTWTDVLISLPQATGGLISGFSSIGMAADLTLKPDIGAPGGSIFSTIPLELGGHGLNSGTSMSSPHVAGAVALLLQGVPGIAPAAVRARLQNSADPKNWSGNPGLGFLDYAHRQGAGMLDIDDSILATVDVTPGKLAIGESEAGPQTRTLTIRNRGASPVTFDLSHVPALATGPKSQVNFATVSTFSAPATVNFSAASVTVPAGSARTVDVTVDANAGLADRSQYGGYVVLTPQGGGQTYRVPFAGVKGDYQTIPVLTPTANGFPWLARLNAAGDTFTRETGAATYTMVGNDIPRFLVHLDHHSRYYEFRITNAATGQPVHPVFSNFDQDEFVGRNTTAGGFFDFPWDGTRSHDNGGGTANHRKVVPDGTYVVTLRVLKALGDPANPAHWETFISPAITIDRQ